MEASDTFGQGIDTPDDDPFKETSMEEFDQSDDPLADGNDALAEIGPVPIVNREGEVIEEPAKADAAIPVETPEERAMREHAEEELAAEEANAPVADPPPAPMAGDQTAQSAGATTADGSPVAAQGAGVDPGVAPPPPEKTATSMSEAAGETGAAETDPQPADPVSSATPNSDQTTPSSPVAADANAPATSPGDVGPTDASVIQEPAAEKADPNVAPLPKEKKDKTGLVTHRRYILLTPEGNGKHAEVSWHEDKGGKMVKKGTPGAKKQSVCLARGQEEALAIGYQALGSPDAGVPLRAVAFTYWGELTHVEPDEDPPIRQRLKFRR
jgi:hypothetical protein